MKKHQIVYVKSWDEFLSVEGIEPTEKILPCNKVSYKIPNGFTFSESIQPFCGCRGYIVGFCKDNPYWGDVRVYILDGKRHDEVIHMSTHLLKEAEEGVKETVYRECPFCGKQSEFIQYRKGENVCETLVCFRCGRRVWDLP